MKQGFFISLEGIDGSGKTTQVPLLVKHLEARGFSVLTVREPGGTPISEKIREILLDANNQEMSYRTEALLYAAARAQLVDQIIKPALSAGKVVVADRFMDSTIAYQGYGRGIDIGFLKSLNALAIAGTVPDLTLILMVSPRMALERRKKERDDRVEMEGLLFQEHVSQGYRRLAEEEAEERAGKLDQGVLDGYLALARREHKRIQLIDAEGNVEQVAAVIRERVDASLKEAGLI